MLSATTSKHSTRGLSLELNKVEPEYDDIVPYDHPYDRKAMTGFSFKSKKSKQSANYNPNYHHPNANSKKQDIINKYGLTQQRFYKAGASTERSNKIIRGGGIQTKKTPNPNWKKSFNNRKLSNYKPLHNELNNITEHYHHSLESTNIHTMRDTGYGMRDTGFGHNISLKNSPKSEIMHRVHTPQIMNLAKTKITDHIRKRNDKPAKFDGHRIKTTDLSINEIEDLWCKTQEVDAPPLHKINFNQRSQSKMVI